MTNVKGRTLTKREQSRLSYLLQKAVSSGMLERLTPPTTQHRRTHRLPAGPPWKGYRFTQALLRALREMITAGLHKQLEGVVWHADLRTQLLPRLGKYCGDVPLAVWETKKWKDILHWKLLELTQYGLLQSYGVDHIEWKKNLNHYCSLKGFDSESTIKEMISTVRRDNKAFQRQKRTK